MKKIVLLLVLIPVSISMLAQISRSFDITNNKEWSKSLSHSDRVKLLQLSDAEKKEMNTLEILDVCLQYPYNIDIIAYTDIRKAFDILAHRVSDTL